jgi:hypothetical protein
MLMRRLLILILTRGAAEGGGIFTEPNTVFGTESPLEIQVVSRDRLVVLFEISETSQMDLDTGYANFYTVPVIVPFSKGELDDSSVTLRLKGLDIWEPASFFLFGLDTAAGRPEAIVPLVHLPEWPFGFMEADATNGVASINLPLLSGQSAPID